MTTHILPTPLPSPDVPTDKQICLYIAEMCAELRDMANSHQMRTIGYLLDMARLEAENTSRDRRH